MQFFVNTKYDFIKLARPAIALSVIVILIGVISLVVHKGPVYGIDFLGGTSIELSFQKPVSISEVRSALTQAGYGNVEIKSFGASNEILIRVQQEEGGSAISDDIIAEIKKAFPNNPSEVKKIERVGPKIGAELRKGGIWATLISLLGILIYVSWRFEFVFAVGAIVALIHDVLVTLSFFSLFEKEFTLAVLAAFLTIVGYSVNDTIVVFDRIRENSKIYRRDTLESIINLSVNQTLSRTILTSGTVLIVVLVLFFFGGEVIHDFAYAMLVGCISGSYSTVYIASPIVVEWEKWRQAKKHKAVLKNA